MVELEADGVGGGEAFLRACGHVEDGAGLSGYRVGAEGFEVARVGREGFDGQVDGVGDVYGVAAVGYAVDGGPAGRVRGRSARSGWIHSLPASETASRAARPTARWSALLA